MINPYVTLAITAFLFLLIGFLVGGVFATASQQAARKKELEENRRKQEEWYANQKPKQQFPSESKEN